MRVATWNVNGLRARQDFVLHWLASRKPDVVGLQELKLPDEQFPHEAFRDAGYHAVSHGQKSWNGVAILAREEPRVTQRGLPGQEELGARLISAEVGGLAFTTIYVPNGKTLDHADFPKKLVWLDALLEQFSPAGEAPAVLCGDFNVCPGPLDTWRGERGDGRIFCTDEERSRLDRLLEAGFVDVFRDRHPGEQRFSWWDYRGGAFHKGEGLRIDLLLATPAAAKRVRAIEIDRDYRKKKDGLIASDHAPVYADLD